MSNARALVLTLLLAGCASDAASRAGAEPLLVEAGTVIAQDGDRTLVRGAASSALAQTDERPTYAMEIRGPNGVTASPGRVLTGVLVRGGALWVRPDGTLEGSDGQAIDRDVLPELSVARDALRVAYARHARRGGGVVVLDVASGERTEVSGGLALADRPLFLPDGRLVVIGARASGIAGVWIVDPSGRAQPVAVTNGELRVGRPFGARFVPPPAHHASMHVEDGELVYDDGMREQRVALPEAS